MNAPEQLRDLYSTLSLFPGGDEAASRLAAVIAEMAAALHPPGTRSIARFEADDGAHFEVDLGDRLGRALYYGYQQERIELSLFEQVCPIGGHIWDVGANFGLYTVKSARRVGPAGKVHAFEPGAFARKLLLTNLAANRVEDRVVVHDTALADRDGTGTFFETEESAFSGLKDTERAKVARQVPVRLARIDTIWQEARVPADRRHEDRRRRAGGRGPRGASRAIDGSPNLVLLVETAAKNTNAEEKRRIVRCLERLGSRGFRLWLPSRDQAGLREYLPKDAALPEGGENLFIVRRDTDREMALSRAAMKAIGAADPGLGDRERSLLSTVKLLLLQCALAKGAAHAARQEMERELASLRAAHDAELAASRAEVERLRAKLEAVLSATGLEAAQYREQLEATLARRLRKWLKRLRTGFRSATGG